MQFLDTIKYHVAQLDTKTFFAYLGGFLLGIFFIMSGIFYYYYSATESLALELEELNEKRTTVRTLFERETRLKKQEAEVNKMLKEGKNFKLADYFKKVTDKLRLYPNEQHTPVETVQLEGKYREYTLPVRFDNIDMKQICDLLAEIDTEKRVYTKSLDILRSKSTPTKLNVNLTIGTLENEIPGA